MRRMVVCAGLLLAQAGFAGVVSITGSLDPADPNSTFQYLFSTAAAGPFVAQSYGYGGGVNGAGVVIPAGGFDTYLSLFAGSDANAAFLASADDGGCPPAGLDPACRDSRLEIASLAAGDYVLVVATFGNMSFAENYGSGTLGDGFIGLGNYFDWDNMADRTSAFAVDVETAAVAIPEIDSEWLWAPVLLVAAWRRKQK